MKKGGSGLSTAALLFIIRDRINNPKVSFVVIFSFPLFKKTSQSFKITNKMEEEEFNIPDELKKEIIDIMNDSPDLKKIGDKD